MKTIKLFFVFALLVPLTSSAQKPKIPLLTNNLRSAPARPKLVIGLVVDQMRWDYLYRYASRYGAGGFNRLLSQGFSCENTHIPNIPTYTAAGHTGIYTGSVPAIHGIVANSFINQATGKMIYCAEDSTAKTVGSTSSAGELSPVNMKTTTITDELKLATNFKSKVIGIAIKDRGGILPAGHSANAAYWFDDLTGNWITSTYYMKQLPAWVNAFNDQKLPEKYIKQDWHTLYPIDTYNQSSADDNAYEGKLPGEKQAVFPHYISKLMKDGFGAIRTSPQGNTLTFDFAKATLKNEHLGKGKETDFLTVSLSSTDYVGHRYGINAIETEDTYLRLDKDLEDFLNTLDATIGKGQYTIFLTADHGASHNPYFLKDNKIPAGAWPTATVLKSLNAVLQTEFNFDKMVLSLNNYQVNFNNQLLETNKLDLEKIKIFTIDYLKKVDGVWNAIDMEKVAIASIPEGIKSKIINGYNRERCGAIQILLQPAYFSMGGKTGTSHGTWGPQDSHIPLVFMGWGIKQGSLNRITSMTDIAPTLAALLHIQEPNGNIGHPIEEVLKK